ncbi:Eco57I restriction-modification methylase domain-containing protein [Chryseobacterium sp. A301]
MPQTNNIDIEILNGLIFGRVEPHIYAFSTGTIPNYLKVGDTYRPIEKRLNEWRKHFPNLEKKFSDVAKADEETFFRDLSIHQYLEIDLNKLRLLPATIPNIPYYSKEFFENTTTLEINDAIADIKESHTQNNGKYRLYTFDKSRIPTTYAYSRTQNFQPRPNQQETINRFKVAIDNGRTNLLMYAVMRFGKSFTSMCCAVEMDAKIVVVVSAKADVKMEWKRTIESHVYFEEYSFLDSDALLMSDQEISEKLAKNKKVAIFLTLQDLQGADIKIKHQELFDNEIDILIIDETHFGARANEYGRVLQLSNSEVKKELKQSDETLEDLKDSLKIFDAKIRLHLSGTPYRILMGSEFSQEDIIAFYQFTDIADDQEKWDGENLNKDDVKEWENPYYGFPQMIRFAFNPNESSLKKMDELKKSGVTYAFSALFKPKSITKDSTHQNHTKFQNEQEILDLWKIIDGATLDDNLLSFLDYDKIKEGNMCRHIVCVLPYRASCDALEHLIINNLEKFKNLNQYEIINIAGVEDERKFNDTKKVILKIKELEAVQQKSITLTVNRMLTGTTVEEWDTMLYFKDTASPQEYDQAIFRLQNQYVKDLIDDNNNVIKINMKPQTLLVDFDPNRMFIMQEQKSKFYNVNTEANGNTKLEQRLKRELEVSPIITLNSNKLVQVTPTNILDAVRKYSSEKSVLDEATSIPVDFSLLQNAIIRSEIDKQGEIGSKQGLEISATQADGNGDELTVSEPIANEENNTGQINTVNTDTPEKNTEENVFKNKFATYYSKILFFSFLTTTEVKSLQHIIDAIDADVNSLRIASNLGLSKSILEIIQTAMNTLILNELDYKILNINTLTSDANLSPIQRAGIAMRKFTRLSESEIVTPEKVANKMMSIFAENALDDDSQLLDVASKQGEFVYAAYKKYGKEIAGNFYSIPTSKVAYEFTRKVYELLGLDVSHIEENYTSFDLLNNELEMINKDEIKINSQDMKFDVIVGNPPYQVMDGGAQASARPIYQEFVKIAKQLDPEFISMIIPTRWFSGGKGLDEFRKEMLNDARISQLHDFLNPKLLFQDTNNRGGICFFLWDKNYNNIENFSSIFTYNNSFTPTISTRNLKTENSDIFIRHGLAIEIIKKINNDLNFQSFENHISARKPFGLEGKIIRNKDIFKDYRVDLVNHLKCYGRGKKIGYVNSTDISNRRMIDRFKIFTPYANNIGTELQDDNLNTFVGKPNEICTESYLVIGADLELDLRSATNLSNYFKTKFVRFLHSLAKISQHGTSKTYKFVPLQDFTDTSDIRWEDSIQGIAQQLYAKYNLTQEEIDFIESMIKPMA